MTSRVCLHNALSYGGEVGTPDEVGTLSLKGKRTCKQSVTSFIRLMSITTLKNVLVVDYSAVHNEMAGMIGV